MRTLALLTVVALTGLYGCSTDNAVDSSPGDSDNTQTLFGAAEENTGEWVWLPVEESICRDGSSTGIGVRLQSDSTNLLVYMQGGGACYDQASCEANAKGPVAGVNYGFDEFNSWVGSQGSKGIFNTSNQSNRLRDWNSVYIPYCSSDVHAGNRTDVSIPGVDGKLQFVGYQNTGKFVEHLAGYFTNPEQMLLAGSSAGGIGVTLNYEQFAKGWPAVNITALLDSSALPLDSAMALHCFESKIISAFDPPALVNCPTCQDVEQGGLVNFYSYLSAQYPMANFALYSADADFAGWIGLNKESLACGGSGVNFVNYRLAMYRLRDSILSPAGNWSTMYPAGLNHTFTGSDQLYFEQRVDGVTIAVWLSTVLDGQINHLAP